MAKMRRFHDFFASGTYVFEPESRIAEIYKNEVYFGVCIGQIKGAIVPFLLSSENPFIGYAIGAIHVVRDLLSDVEFNNRQSKSRI